MKINVNIFFKYCKINILLIWPIRYVTLKASTERLHLFFNCSRYSPSVQDLRPLPSLSFSTVLFHVFGVLFLSSAFRCPGKGCVTIISAVFSEDIAYEFYCNVIAFEIKNKIKYDSRNPFLPKLLPNSVAQWIRVLTTNLYALESCRVYNFYLSKKFKNMFYGQIL